MTKKQELFYKIFTLIARCFLNPSYDDFWNAPENKNYIATQIRQFREEWKEADDKNEIVAFSFVLGDNFAIALHK